jgi:activator of HSP90 ATPase
MQPMDNKVSRRHIGLILGCLGGGASAQAQKPSTTIHLEIDFQTTPGRIYQALLDAKQFSAFTNAAAEIQPQPGGTFKLFAEQIEGRNIELIPNQRIVQAWRPASWPAGVYSIVRFELAARGAGTRIVFDHAGFTEDKREELADGWQNHYFGPLRKYLNA